MLKAVYIFNWTIIGLLALFSILLLLDPNRNGGDAASKGMGGAFLTLSLGGLAVMLALNLSPWVWTKYLATFLVLGPLVFFFLASQWSDFQKRLQQKREDAKPLFEDKNLDRMARLIRDANPDALKEALPTLPQAAVHHQDILWFAINEASYENGDDAKLRCVRLLIEAGAPLDSLIKDPESPPHEAAAFSGNAALLRLLFERGADPNLANPNSTHPLIFDAVISYIQPLEAMRAFLDFGADPNVKAILDDEEGPSTPLIRAAKMERWDICALLLERGADPDFKTRTGNCLDNYIKEATEHVVKYGTAETQANFARLVKMREGH